MASPQAQSNSIARVNVLKNLLIGRGDLWLLQDSESILAAVVTTLYIDPITGSKHLMIWGLNIIGKVTKVMANKALFTLQMFAKDSGCYDIIGFTSFESVSRLVENAGGDSSRVLINIPLDARFTI